MKNDTELLQHCYTNALMWFMEEDGEPELARAIDQQFDRLTLITLNEEPIFYRRHVLYFNGRDVLIADDDHSITLANLCRVVIDWDPLFVQTMYRKKV